VTICRHLFLTQIDETHYMCKDCGVWKGVREDAHYYTHEYYTNPTFGLFSHGIPRRTAVYSGYMHEHFGPLGISFDFSKMPKVLEIGAGVGLISYSLFLDGCDVQVVESSEWASKWMEEAYGQHDGFHSYWCNFELMDRDMLGVDFDFIFANHVWEHLEDPMEAMEWCFRVLKPGGKLFLIVPDQDRERAMHHTHNWGFDVEPLKLWYKQAGFEDVRAEKYDGCPQEQEEGGQLIRIVGTSSGA
jgi:SAM-dependent methyltransferase